MTDSTWPRAANSTAVPAPKGRRRVFTSFSGTPLRECVTAGELEERRRLRSDFGPTELDSRGDMELDDITTTNHAGLNDACGPAAMAEHGCKAAGAQGVFHAGARVTAARQQEPGIADFQICASGELEIESTDSQVSLRLFNRR